jgi:hypothetical protein
MKTADNQIVHGCEDVLAQGLALLQQLDGVTYAQPLAPPFAASVGQHYRHVIDHFQCFLEGVAAGCIDYDRRRRERRIEQDLQHARRVTMSLLERLQALESRQLSRPCLVRFSVGYGDPQPKAMPSNLARELSYCISHAVHHFAIVRLLCDQLRVTVPDEFGVAPSTVRYRATSQLAN